AGGGGGGGFGSGAPALGGVGRGRAGIAGAAPMAGPGDAGVAIYSASSFLTNSADVINAYRKAEKEARATLSRKDATKDEKDKAQTVLRDIEKADKVRGEATAAVVKKLEDATFVRGFATNPAAASPTLLS